MTELLDVMNDNGEFSGTRFPRFVVHKEGFWHRTVHVYVYRIIYDKIEILVHFRSPRKDLYPNTWDPVFGGHVQSGDTPTQTVVEELHEEIGLSISPDDLVSGPVLKADKGSDKEFNHLFAYQFSSNAVLRFKDKEVQKVRWVGINEVLDAIQSAPSEWRPTLEEFETAYSVVVPMVRQK